MSACVVGHKTQAMECPGCSEARSGVPRPVEHWKWYRGRTSSQRIRAAVDLVLAQRDGMACARCGADAREVPTMVPLGVDGLFVCSPSCPAVTDNPHYGQQETP